ncbi:MAG: N-6 DNA methylase [Planctomycetes bacterium]|nr:N-6 DNA methylase [Planctomycetota bacterium]
MNNSENQNPWSDPIVCNGDTSNTVNQIVKLIEHNYYLFGGWTNAFEQVLDLTLYALNRQEDKYMETIRAMDKRAVTITSQIVGMLMKVLCYDYCIWDYLGEVYMQIASMSKSKVLGQFFTPFHICEMMAKVQLGNIKSLISKSQRENRRVSIMEPCVGSGAMLLACKKIIIEEVGLSGLDHFEFFGQDIDPVCVKMCRIQMILTDYRYMTNLLLIHAVELQNKIATANESSVS